MIFSLYFLFPNLMIVILVFGYSIVAVCRSIRPFVSKLAYFYNIVLNFIQAFFSECCILDKHDVKNLNTDFFKSLFGESNYSLKLFYIKMFILDFGFLALFNFVCGSLLVLQSSSPILHHY